MIFDCENCGFTPKTEICSSCNRDFPVWANFCPFCGMEITRSSRALTDGGDPFAMENRRLCPDGNCIGILDTAGNCVICGKR